MTATLTDSGACARCAQTSPTCCRLTPGHEELCFPVSEMERQRIVEYGPASGGLTGERNSAAFLDNLFKLFPADKTHLAKTFARHGEHLRLATLIDGTCVFLGPQGCQLPRAVRPYYCRLFPFWVSAGAVTAFAVPDCLACREGRTVPGMLALLGVSRPMVLQLHGRMRLAWGMSPWTR